MNRFLKFKTLLFLMLFAFAGNNAFATSNDLPVYCDSHLQVRVKTGQGKVYAANPYETSPSTNSCTSSDFIGAFKNTRNGNYRPCPFKILAIPEPGYEFDYWECVQNIGDYDVNKATSVGTKLYISNSENQAGSIWDVKAAFSKRKGSSASVNGTESDVINAIWEAHFKEIITKYVDVESENTSLGTAVIDKGNNNIGDEVTITASCNSTNIMFKGWYRMNETTGEKEFVTKDNPFTFTISNNPDNTGTYYARFEGGYYFWRIRNNFTNHYITARAKYTGQATASNLRNALSTQLAMKNDLSSSITDEGTMMNIFVAGQQAQTGKDIWDIYVQDEHTRQYYDETPGSGVFLQITHQADNPYLIQGNGDSFYVTEENNSLSASFDFNNIRPYGKWQLEGMDKDLTTKENYFAVDPNEFVGPDANGYYWTTLRVCFNMMYETSEITPFIVTAADADNGTLEIEEVTGGIIPAKTCVLLRCNSTDVLRNVMIPTRNSSSFNTNSNLLTSSQYYYKNQTVEGSLNLKGITISDGQLGFGGNTLTSVDGNRAYLSVANDVALEKETPEVTLAELLASGDTQNTYIVTDLTAVEIVNDDQLIIAKDNNGCASKDENTNEYVDYMHMASGISNNELNIAVPEEYDQSNWIALRVPAGASLTTNMKGKHLTHVKGRLVNTVNPEFVLDELPGNETEGAASTALNVYIPASFKGSQKPSQKDYFFVQPKPMEMANITWAQWDGEKFISPVHDDAHPDWNQAELVGSFELNGAYLESQDGGGLDMSTLKAGHAYAMTPAVVKLKTGNYDHVYVLGNVNGTNWNTNKGVEMETTDGTVYTAIVTVNDSGDDYGYFSFTKKLGATWEDINSSRFGSEASGDYWDVLDGNYNTPLTLRYWGGDTRSFRVPEGTYRLTVTLANGENFYAGTVVIQRAGASQAPRRKADGDNGYVVYPISMTQITSEENNVVTGVSTVGGDRVAVSRQYVNVAGVRASQPWNGVNIVITTYSDGTTTATKIVK